MKTTKDCPFDSDFILENLLIQDHQSQQQQQVVAKMLVVIDQKVEDYKLLAAGVKSGAEVLILDSHRDGVEQITAALQGYTEFNSIHLVSHGSPCCLYLGNSQLSLHTLNQYAPQLRSWFSPALLLYGCNVACGDAGAEFIERLHQLTGAKIAASANPTGNKVLGGNWELEVTTGEMAVSLAFAIALRESYSGLLASVDVDWSFGNNSKVTSDTSLSSDKDRIVTLQTDGKIIVLEGNSNVIPSDFALVRYNSDGSIDTSFGSNGIVTTDALSNPDNVGGITLQSDGKILLAGSSFNDNSFNFNLVRYHSDGNLDTSFGSNGIVTVGGSDQVYDIAFGADGSIVAVGDINNQLVVVTYNSSEETFSINVSAEADAEGTLTINTINNIGDVTINSGSFNVDVGSTPNISSSLTILSSSSVNFGSNVDDILQPNIPTDTVDNIEPINGAGGNLTINTDTLSLRRGSSIAVGSNINDLVQRNIPTDTVDNTEPINAGGNLTINAGNTISISAVDNTDPINAGGTITVTSTNPNSTFDDSVSIISNETVTVLNKAPEDYFLLISDSSQAQLQFTLTERDTSFVNEVGVFIVDDLQGRIDGISPGDLNYLQAALERGQVILSSLSNNVFPELSSTRQLSLDTGDFLGFYLVQKDTTDNVLADLAAGQTPANVFFNFSDANPDGFDYLEVSPLAENSLQLNWEDSFTGGEADFNDLVLTVDITDNSPPLGTQLQGGQQAEIIDLRDQITGIVAAEFVINSDAAFDNTFGFYLVDNPNGIIGNLNPGDSGYAQAAVSNRIDLTSGLPGEALLAPFLIADGTAEEFLTTNPNNQSGQKPLAYFTYLEANPDGFDHVRLLGDNLFGFEDLEGGGDADYNDLVIAVNFL